MMIPNKFNGYMSDGRRLYPDPATSAIMAKALATAGTASTAAAVPVATTAAANLGTTAALEASKQGIMKAGADVMAQEAAKQVAKEGVKQVAQEGVKQAGTETLKQGIMQGADDAAAMNLNQVNALNPAVENTAAQQQVIDAFSKPATDLSQFQQFVPEASNTTSQLVPKGAPTGTTSVNPIGPNAPDIATNSLQLPETAYQQSGGSGLNPFIKNSTQPLKANPGMEVGQANLQAPAPSPTAGLKPPPSALERGFSAAKEFAGDTAKFAKENPLITSAGIMAAQSMSQPSYNQPAKKSSKGYGGGSGGDFKYGEPSTGTYTPIFEPTPYAVGGPVEQMSMQNAVGNNTGYPMANLQTPMYSNPMVQRPMPTNVINPSGDAGVNMYSGEARMATGGKVNAFEKMMQEDEARRRREAAQSKSDLDQEAKSLAGRTKPYSRTQSTNSPYAAAVKELQALSKKYGIKTAAPAKTNVDLMGDQDQIEYAANGGIMHGLGGYSDGGRLLKGPGDGVSDSIPAVIGNKQPARLADGEFVIPARIVSELGNGSTEAGARKLYAMMERVQKRRGKTTGKGKVAVNSKADKHLPA
jgi:hypothetical protein